MFLTAGKHQSLPLGTPRKYGISGGAICPKCQRPFALHFFALNLGLGKFDRCPYCGKWSVLRPRPIAELRQAEEVELQAAMDAALPPEVSEEEKLRRELDDSRFQDS
jgi:DNA-directed RNA polymerase subunit RPC12/RpoP